MNTTNRPQQHRPIVGVAGLGLVGTALAARLLAAGYTVVGHDHRPEALAAWLAGAGPQAEGARDARDLGLRCAQVVLAVYDTAGVLELAEGAEGLLAAPQAAVRALIDCSTGEPEALAALAQRLTARGVDFIEAPLSGSSRQVAEGSATMLLGGDARALARHAGLLSALSPRQLVVGTAGMGARAKLATNLVLGLNRAALAEGLVFAASQGIAAETFLELVLATPARSEAAVQKGARMVRGEFAPESRVRQHLKDVQLMQAAAASQGQQLPLTAVHAQLLQAAVDAGDGELDNAAIVRQLQRERRLPVNAAPSDVPGATPPLA